MRLDHLLSKEQRELRGRIDVWWSEKLINCLILRELQEGRELRKRRFFENYTMYNGSFSDVKQGKKKNSDREKEKDRILKREWKKRKKLCIIHSQYCA